LYGYGETQDPRFRFQNPDVAGLELIVHAIKDFGVLTAQANDSKVASLVQSVRAVATTGTPPVEVETLIVTRSAIGHHVCDVLANPAISFTEVRQFPYNCCRKATLWLRACPIALEVLFCSTDERFSSPDYTGGNQKSEVPQHGEDTPRNLFWSWQSDECRPKQYLYESMDPNG
jgi:hypothetical protein